MPDFKKDDSQIDQFDRKIIEVLVKDGRLPVTEIAKEVGLSKTPCQIRLKKLREQGYILGFQAIINHQKLKCAHIAFTEVKLSDTREKALEAFNAAIREITEVEECHLIAGAFDYLLKVRTYDIVAYRAVLAEKISSLPFIANTSTYVAMEAVKESHYS